MGTDASTNVVQRFMEFESGALIASVQNLSTAATTMAKTKSAVGSTHPQTKSATDRPANADTSNAPQITGRMDQLARGTVIHHVIASRNAHSTGGTDTPTSVGESDAATQCLQRLSNATELSLLTAREHSTIVVATSMATVSTALLLAIILLLLRSRRDYHNLLAEIRSLHSRCASASQRFGHTAAFTSHASFKSVLPDQFPFNAPGPAICHPALDESSVVNI